VTAVFQYISTFDSTVFKTVSRVGDQLREIIYFKMNEIDLTKSRTFGDVIPKLKSNSQQINLNYEILHESDVEHVINRINFDIFGSSLVQIPDPNNTYLIFIACHLDHTIQNNIDYS